MEIVILGTIVFVILKLIHVIDWSWWWVLSPLWIAAIISGIIYGVSGTAILFGKFFKAETKEKRSRKRILLCIIGAILLYIAGVQSNFAYEYYEWTLHRTAVAILLPLSLYLTIYGSYLWAKDKGRSTWWCLLGLIAPFGYIALMRLKDKYVPKEVGTQAQQDTTPIILPPPENRSEPRTSSKSEASFCMNCGQKVTPEMTFCPGCGKKTSGKLKTNFCPHCGYKVASGAIFCPNCDKPLIEVDTGFREIT